RLARLGTPAAVVERLFAARTLRLAHRLELGRRRVAVVRLVLGDHPLGDLAVAVEPLQLVDRAFLVVEAEPAHRRQDLLGRFIARARDVGVLDPQDEVAAVVARERPREERGARGAEVEKAGRRRGDARADALAGRDRRRRVRRTHSVVRPRARSASISATSSSPIATRIIPCVIPAAARCSSLSLPCDVLAGCVIVVLVSPRLAVIEHTCVESMTWNALRRAAAGPPPRSPRTMNETTAPPLPDCCAIASACCGCDSSAGK